MKKLLISAIFVTLTASTALAARGDNGEGQGGGSRVPTPTKVPTYATETYYETHYRDVTLYRTESRTETRYRPKQITQKKSVTVPHPAALSSECNKNNGVEESFDDFASGCKIIPAYNEVIQVDEVVTIQEAYPYTYTVQVPYTAQEPYTVTLTRQVVTGYTYTCPSPYIVGNQVNDRGIVTGKICYIKSNDRGNGGGSR